MEIESMMLEKEFYTCNFQTIEEACAFLKTDLSILNQILDDYKMSLTDFIVAMRIEDVKDSMTNNPHISLDQLSKQHGFESINSLLFNFYIQEACTPNRWLEKNGLLPDNQSDTP
ncbi:MAG: hypothetical protein ACRDCS_00240 [Tannerellaceae bacterium]